LQASETFTNLFDSMARALKSIGDNLGAIKETAKAVGALGVAFLALKLHSLAVNGIMNIMTTSFYRHVIASRTLTVATKAQAIAQGALNAVMKANPITLFLSAATLLIPVIFSLAKKTERARHEQEKFNEAVEEGIQHTNDLFEQAKNVNSTTEERVSAIKELQKLYLEYFSNLDAEKSKLEDLEKAQSDFNRAISLTQRLRKSELQLDDNIAKQAEISSRLKRIGASGSGAARRDLLKQQKELQKDQEQLLSDIANFENELEQEQQATKKKIEKDEQKAATEAYEKAKSREFELRRIQVRAIQDKNTRELETLKLRQDIELFKAREDAEKVHLLKMAHIEEEHELTQRLFSNLKPQTFNRFQVGQVPSIPSSPLSSVGDIDNEFNKNSKKNSS